MKRKRLRALLDRYRVTAGEKFHLKDCKPDDVASNLIDSDKRDALLADGVVRLAALQELLYPQQSWVMLCVFQGMDASGKDGTIKHVMSGVNPQGVTVASFKQPGPEDLAHDFLWRVTHALPRRGQIGIFNRSHYEEVLAVRVHPELLQHQHLPPERAGAGTTGKVWKHRLDDIAGYERYLARQGYVVLKFFLHMSRDEQRRRFVSRIDTPGKNWKFNLNDVTERAHWDAYQHAYEQAIAGTAAPHAPWFVVPADNKWFARLVVVEAMVAALEDLDLQPPQLDDAETAMLREARASLEDERGR